jgi:serine/threonine-protein kinase RsbW
MSAEPAAFLPEAWTARAEIKLDIGGSPLEVRAGLDRLLGSAALSDLSEEARGTLWIVMAEVMNNIVEHAYAGIDDAGDIRLRMWRHGSTVAVEVTDSGAPMPGLTLPEGRLADVAPGEDLPEGGFGWFLIRSLTDWLIYDRVGEVNRLRFCMDC